MAHIRLDSHFNSLTFKIDVGLKLAHLATLSISNICIELSVNKLRIRKGQLRVYYILSNVHRTYDKQCFLQWEKST